jgi:hypothetical protein
MMSGFVCVLLIHNENCKKMRALAFSCPSIFADVTTLETSERIFMKSETVLESYTKIS